MPREPPVRLVVADHQRLAARVGAGHHQHEVVRAGEPRHARRTAGGLVEQQVLQRRAGQHRAEPGEAGRDAGQRFVGTGALLQQHDRPLGGFEERTLRGADPDQRAERGDARRHHRERLRLARLALAQRRDGRAMACVAGEVVATQPLDRDDPALPQQRERTGDRIAVDRRAVDRPERERRPARGAGIRLGVKAPVGRCRVLRSGTRGTARTPPCWSSGGRRAARG